MSDDQISAAIQKQLAPPAPPDALQQGLNYHPQNPVANTALGVLQGAGKGLMSTGLGALDVISKMRGAPSPVDPAYQQSVTQPNGPGQGTGKFLEQTAEFALPAGVAGDALKGASLGARLAAQAGIGAGISAAQSGGDPVSTISGGVLGGSGELLGAAAKGFKALAAQKAPTLANFAESFGGATPTQKARITNALGTLAKDGIVPPDGVHATQDVVKTQLGKLGQAYDALPADIPNRQLDALSVMGDLQKQQNKFVSANGHILSENRAAYDMLGRQINDVASVADQNSGKISFQSLRELRDAANGKTNFASPEAEQNLFRDVGDVYRSAMDKVAPETTPLNRDYARYKDLESIIDQNISRGKGVAPSGLDILLRRAASHGTGAAAGATVGHAVAGAPGALLGTILGGAVGPKLAASSVQALQNAADAGALQGLNSAKIQTLKMAVRIGDNSTIMRLLGALPKEISTKSGGESLAPPSGQLAAAPAQ
jgi:hypothetical protein